MLDNKQPLWMPAGSVRAILAFIVVAPIAYLSLRSGVILTGDQIVGLVSLVLTAYFINKSATAK